MFPYWFYFMVLVALVGMPGAGKSIAADFFVSKKFAMVYFGGIVLDETKKRGLELNEPNERRVREELRQLHGMAAMAFLSTPKIRGLLEKKQDVVIDDLYSWSELVTLKQEFEEIITIAIFASPETRYARMAKRKERHLTREQCISRDRAEIENLEKGGPIAMADYTIINEGTQKEFEKQLISVLKKIKK